MSEYNMSHTGAQLDDAINKVKSGYILPTGNINITTNGEYDVAEFAKAMVNVPVPEGYIELANIITHTTNDKYTTGDFVGSGQTLNNISINVGFKPKIFYIQNLDAVYNNSTSAPYSLVGSLMLNKDDSTVLLRKVSFVLRGDSTNGYGRGGQSSLSNGFAPTDNGVQGMGSSVKANNGVIYNWWAWG